MKTALVHDWLISSIGGAENTLREIHSLFPSPIYTLLWKPDQFTIDAKISTSFIQHLPGDFRNYLPLFPLAIRQFDLSDYDVIISSSHCVAHGIRKQPHQLHICYCHTPMRYAWDLSEEYLRGFKAPIARACFYFLRKWDIRAAQRVDHFIANSHFVAARIRKFYGRESTVIHPPVNTSFFNLSETKENFYVTSSRLVPYKKVDLIVEAFAQMPDLRLIVIGDGPEAKKLRSLAKKNIEFLGVQSDFSLRHYLQRAKAFVFAAVEDFGIAPVEAMACGTPIIALRKGGALDTVIESKTGVFFDAQTAEAIQRAVRMFERMEFDPVAIARHAERFSSDRFRKELVPQLKSFEGFG